jgi:hypothetical protein
MYGKEHRETWGGMRVTVTREPGRGLPWRRLLLALTIIILLYSGIKSITYSGDRAAMWQQEMAQVGPDIERFMASLR